MVPILENMPKPGMMVQWIAGRPTSQYVRGELDNLKEVYGSLTGVVIEIIDSGNSVKILFNKEIEVFPLSIYFNNFEEIV